MLKKLIGSLLPQGQLAGQKKKRPSGPEDKSCLQDKSAAGPWEATAVHGQPITLTIDETRTSPNQ